jgi:hypothetical protein
MILAVGPSAGASSVEMLLLLLLPRIMLQLMFMRYVVDPNFHGPPKARDGSGWCSTG